MKKLLTILTIILISTSCKKDLILPAPIVQTITDTTKIIQDPTPQKVGFIIDTIWFKSAFRGYTIQTHNWYGHGDFNNDGLDDLVVMFASNSSQYYFYQQNMDSRVVVGVFINHKTYFELNTDLVYSYLGGWNGVNVADMNGDGYLDIYQMTGYWETNNAPKPSYYNNNGWGGMDSYVFMNDKNKGFTRYTIPVNDCAGSSTTIINGNKIYTSACMVNYEYNGNGFTTNNMNLNKTFNGVSYDLRVITPKCKKGNDTYYIASNNFSDEYLILKTNGNNLNPILKYTVPYHRSGHTEGTNGERSEMYVIDLDKDGKDEYIIPSQIFNTDTTPNTPYLLIIDSYGNNVTTKFLDAGLEKPLAFNQFNAGIQNVTGFIYHTIKDIDGDDIPEIFPASGLGYKKDNDSYYYKFIDGKYVLKLYHSGWLGDINTNSNRRQYRPFVDEKNRVNAFMVVEGSLFDSFIKTF